LFFKKTPFFVDKSITPANAMLVSGRLAPTPSGFPHLGNALNFALTWLWIRYLDGTLRLRIDDLDQARTRPAYFDALFRTFDWLGLDWDTGPQSPDEHHRLFSQSHRLDLYLEAAERLRSLGLLYPCTCSRKQLAVHAVYPGTCRYRAPQVLPDLQTQPAPFAWRVAFPPDLSVHWVDEQAHPQTGVPATDPGDLVFWTREGRPAYQLASAVDDLLYAITHWVRGRDLLPSTVAQFGLRTWLSESPSLGVPWVFHHPLMLAPDGTKLSKSAGSRALQEFDGQFPPVSRFYASLSAALGLPEPVYTAVDILAYLQHTGQPPVIQMWPVRL
jgi:glutamyl-tRNA synthetase